MGTIFSDMDGLEGASPLMLRRTLLELAAARRAAGGERNVPLRHILRDAGLSTDPKGVSLVLRAVAQNNVVFVDRPGMHNALTLGATLGRDVVIECNPHLVEKWVSRAGGGHGTYALNGIPQDVRDAMIGELDGRIDLLKKRLPPRP